jgi:GNAT superfamily N-acetyltransferase
MTSIIEIHPFVESDLPSLSAVQPPEWPDLLPYFQFYVEAAYCQPFKALYGTKFIGTGSVIFHRNTAWIAHIIVRENHRGCGIGKAITQHLIAIAEKQSPHTISLVATPMGEPLYAKLGFIKDSEYTFFREGQTEAPAMGSIIPAKPDRYEAILDLDKNVSGEDRGTLLRAHLSKAHVFQDDALTLGAFFPTLSEGLIIAATDEAGIDLMKYKYQHGIQPAILPSANQAGVDLLVSAGSKPFRTAARMYLRNKITWHPNKIFGRIGGYLG